jgi:hypothetical protein
MSFRKKLKPVAITAIATVLIIWFALMPATGDSESPDNTPISSTDFRYVWEEGMASVLNLTPLNWVFLSKTPKK